MIKNLLSKFSLGTASFGNIYGILNKNKSINAQEAQKIIDLFCKNGGNQIDTSNGYGESEEMLGNILRDFKNNDLKITTKFLVTKETKIDDIKFQIDNSYRIFGDKLVSILCHTPDIISNDLENIVLKAFKYAESQYNLRKGLSIYQKTEIENNNFTFRDYINEIQAPLNIFDNTANYLKKENLVNSYTKVTARSIFLQGFLISEECIFSRFKEQYLLFKSFCKKNKISNKEMCIRYILQKKFVDSFIVGINKLNHLIELIEILNSINIDHNEQTIISLEDQNSDICFIDPRKWH